MHLNDWIARSRKRTAARGARSPRFDVRSSIFRWPGPLYFFFLLESRRRYVATGIKETGGRMRLNDPQTDGKLSAR